MKSVIILMACTITAFAGGYYAASLDDTRTLTKINSASKIENKLLSRNADLILAAENAKDSIKKFDHELSDAQKKIASLQNLNKNLAKQIKQNGLPIATSQSYSDLIEKIDNLPLPLIEEQLKTLFDSDGLKEISDSRDFAKRLLEVALTDNDDDNTQQTSIIFSTSPLQSHRLLDANARVNEFDTIFAHIVSSENRSTVLVKWQRIKSGEIMLLTNQSINNDGRAQYVYFRPAKGWQQGQYKVSVHSMDNKAITLGASDFTIAEVFAGNESNGGIDQVQQDLIESGQAFKKISE